MRGRHGSGVGAVAGLAVLVLVALVVDIGRASAHAQIDRYSAVPRAECGPDDAPESALQGQVPLSDRLSGRSQQEYSCNLELIGQVQDQGASWQMAWYDDCAYFGTARGSDIGTVVVDASKSSKPKVSEYLKTPAMLDPWESLKVNQKRGLLAGAEKGGPGFAIYDVKKDCAHPKLLADVVFPGGLGHEGNWALDGKTYYISEESRDIDVQAIDVSNPRRPRLITEDIPTNPPLHTHGLATSADGTRGFHAGTTVAESGGRNGLTILDYSQIQQRRPNAKATVISEIGWRDGFAAQHPIWVTFDGRPHIIFVDELGSGGQTLFYGAGGDRIYNTPARSPVILGGIQAGPYQACAEGMPPFGFARIIDIGNEKKPKVISKLMLETQDPDNCARVLPDITGQAIFSYDAHYCGVDRTHDPTVLGCGYQNSGIRVFDIRDPDNPKEIAYYIPPARLSQQTSLPGSNHLGVKNADWCAATVRFVKSRGEIWTTCQDNGLVILKFRKGVWPFK